ncbi:hypothetical protein B0H13DRAFT_1888690 [Mycena leptocephala]|nr:hypothetical protein B0H13DRAFT_1888690 [Mycena leptocephala]
MEREERCEIKMSSTACESGCSTSRNWKQGITEKAKKGTNSERIHMNERERNKDWDEMWTQDGAQTREVYARTSAQVERLQKSASAGVAEAGSLSLETNTEAGVPDGLIGGLDRLRWRDKGWGEDSEAWKGDSEWGAKSRVEYKPASKCQWKIQGDVHAGQRHKSESVGPHLRHPVEQKYGMRTPRVGVHIGRQMGDSKRSNWD